jgi:hypothetical protein
MIHEALSDRLRTDLARRLAQRRRPRPVVACPRQALWVEGITRPTSRACGSWPNNYARLIHFQRDHVPRLDCRFIEPNPQPRPFQYRSSLGQLEQGGAQEPEPNGTVERKLFSDD